MSEGTRFAIVGLVEEFGCHLRKTCGFSDGTCCRYTAHARQFLRWKAEGEVDLAGIGPADLIGFVSEHAFHHKPKTSKLVCSALRAFLRFLQLRGLCDARLVCAVPTIPAWKLSALPTYLSAPQVDRLLNGFDRTTPNGRRGYAITQCMLVLGLRAGEVARLSLDDIDWRTGVVGLPSTKGRRTDKLPLPTSVGEALVEYLRYGRPPSSERRVFVRHVRPLGMALSSSAVSRVIRAAVRRLDIDAASKGSHLLRHTAATRMIQAGASLKEIADVLRHRHIDTTMIYAKVDVVSLREVALPWPEAKP